jgi:hypothetical protein
MGVHFGESWLRTLYFDFEGVRRLSEIVMSSDAEQHAVWMRTVSRISRGYAELYPGEAGCLNWARPV